MANEYSILRQIPPPQQVANVDLQFKALAYKQKKFDEGFEDFKTQFNAVANLDIARESGQKYLKQRLSAISNQLGGNVYDFSDSSVSTGLIGAIGQTFDDTVIQEVMDTRRLRKAQTEIAEIKEANDGRYSQANHWDAMQGVADYLKSDNLNTRLPSIEYKNFVDIDARKKEFFDTMYENSETTIDIPIQREIVNKDGSITYEDTGRTKKVTKIGLSEADVERAFEASLTPDERTQMGINGRFTYQGIPSNEMQKEYDSLYAGRISEIETLRQSAKSSGNKSLEKRYSTKIQNLKKQRDNVSALPEKLRHNKQSEFLMKQGYLGSFQTQYQQRVTDEIYGKDDVFFDRLSARDKEVGRALEEGRLEVSQAELKLKQDRLKFDKSKAKSESSDGNSLILPVVDNLEGDIKEFSAASVEKREEDKFRGQLNASTQNLLTILPVEMTKTIKDAISTEQVRNFGKSADIIAMQGVDNLVKSLTKEQLNSLNSDQLSAIDKWELDRQNTESITTHLEKEDDIKAEDFADFSVESVLDNIFTESVTNPPITTEPTERHPNGQLIDFGQSIRGNEDARDSYNKMFQTFKLGVTFVGDSVTPVGNQVNSTNRNTFFANNPSAKSGFNKVALSDVIINTTGDGRNKAMRRLAKEFGMELSAMPKITGKGRNTKIEGGNLGVNVFLEQARNELADQFFIKTTEPTITEDPNFNTGVGVAIDNKEEQRSSRIVENRAGAKSLVVGGKNTTDPLNRFIAVATTEPTTLFSNGEDVRISQGKGNVKRLKELEGAVNDHLISDRFNNAIINLGEESSTIKITAGGDIGVITMEVPTSKELIDIYNQKTGLNVTRDMLQDDGVSLLYDRNFKKQVRTVDKVNLTNTKKRYESAGIIPFDDRGRETEDGMKITPEGGSKLLINRYKTVLGDGDDGRITSILQNADLFNFDITMSDDEILMKVNIKERNAGGDVVDKTVFSKSKNTQSMTRLEQDKYFDAMTSRYNTAPSIAVWDMLSNVIVDTANENTIPSITLGNLEQLVTGSEFNTNTSK